MRGVVTGGFLAIAAAVLWLSFVVGVGTPMGTLLVNLGTEIVGIVITVAVVEWFFEKRRIQNRGRQLAWDAFHSIQQAVWVWQGGPREMDTDEVRGVLDAVGEADPIADFTEGLLLNIGTRSRRLLHNDPAAVEAMPGLTEGLEQLARLSSLRDGRMSRPPRSIAAILDEATRALAQALDRPTERLLPSLIWYRDPSVGMQEHRHFGGGSAARAWGAARTGRNGEPRPAGART